MKHLISFVVIFAAALSAGMVQAKEATGDTASPARTAQREKMKNCNADAKAGNKKGAERKAFMKECLSNKK